MHEIEPFSNWRYIYSAENDEKSPFFRREYSEFEFTQSVYNYLIHPQWDEFGSDTLYLKILMADYELGYAVIELLGEWNDAIENDIMTLRREVTDLMEAKGIYKFILIGENVLNFHSSDDSYYEDWFLDVQDENGWIVLLNLPGQSQYDFRRARLERYIELIPLENWRTYKPIHLFRLLNEKMQLRLNG
jgi:hypothetical protein